MVVADEADEDAAAARRLLAAVVDGFCVAAALAAVPVTLAVAAVVT